MNALDDDLTMAGAGDALMMNCKCHSKGIPLLLSCYAYRLMDSFWQQDELTNAMLQRGAENGEAAERNIRALRKF